MPYTCVTNITKYNYRYSLKYRNSSKSLGFDSFIVYQKHKMDKIVVIKFSH